MAAPVTSSVDCKIAAPVTVVSIVPVNVAATATETAIARAAGQSIVSVLEIESPMATAPLRSAAPVTLDGDQVTRGITLSHDGQSVRSRRC